MQLFTKVVTSLTLLLSASIVGQASAAFTAKKIFQFPSCPFTSIENVAIRPNGQLILSIATAPAVYTLDPSQSSPTATLLHVFSGVSACLGVTAIASDQYAIVLGNVSTTTFTGVPGTFSIWKIDLTKSPAAFSKIAAVPNAKSLNGLTHILSSPSLVLAADSTQGIIYSINTNTGAVATAIQSSAFNPTASFLIGVNGIHASGNVLYYTNSALGTYGQMPINTQGQSEGAATVLANALTGNTYDDFALDPAKNAFIANHANAVTEVTAGCAQSTILNSSTLVQPTSAIFGRDGRTIYVVTAGENSGTVTSGQVFALTQS